MAKFTLTIEDADDGAITISGGFDPPVSGQPGSLQLTPAQSAGLSILSALDGLIISPDGVMTGKGGPELDVMQWEQEPFKEGA